MKKQFNLCQVKETGDIHYFVGLLETSKGTVFAIEIPNKESKVEPELILILKLDFEMRYTLLNYKYEV